MRNLAALLLFALAFALSGCGQPVPDDRAQFVGEWQNKTMYLLITQDGTVKYKRLKGGSSTSISGPLQGFEGDTFDVGIGLMSTTFVIDRPPYQEKGEWKMVIDGATLTRTALMEGTFIEL